MDNILIQYINDEKFDSVWMSIPEVIDWEGVNGFIYTSDNTVYDDIVIEKVIESLRNNLTSVEQLKRKKVVMTDIEGKEVNRWSAYKCVIAEIQFEEKSYCLNNGKWYCINKDFSDKIEKEYATIEISDLEFIDYNTNMEDEDDYNEELSNSLSNSRVCHLK